MAFLDRLPGWLNDLVVAGSDPNDSSDERITKAMLVASVAGIAALATAWYALLFTLGRPWSALIPLGYQLVSVAAIAAYARTGRFVAFRNVEIGMMLVLPVFLQWSLGGFASSGAMIIWAATTVISIGLWGAPPRLLFFGFAVLLAASAILDPWLVANVEQLPGTGSLTLFVTNVGGVSIVTFLVIRYFIAQRDRARDELEQARARSDRLLLNVLPEPIAERLKAGESTRDAHWDGHRAGDRRCDRIGEVLLRPLGRHRQHGFQDGIAWRAQPDSSDRPVPESA